MSTHPAWRTLHAVATSLGRSMALLFAFALLLCPPAIAQVDECGDCHKAHAAEKDSHAELKGRCKACHATIDGSTVPHARNAGVANGLSAAQPQLCLSCHGTAAYTKSNAHTKPANGCAGCHAPHASKNKKLLRSAPPDLCYTCHDQKGFKGEIAHKPMGRGACLKCHDAHSAEHQGMLTAEPVDLCLECHAEVKDQPHVLTSFRRTGHPLGNENPSSPIEDPLRPGRHFNCASCHDPHKGERPNLIRFDTTQAMGFCQRCHKK
jgi:predicted CXXCH cytochrome family protein